MDYKMHQIYLAKGRSLSTLDNFLVKQRQVQEERKYLVRDVRASQAVERNGIIGFIFSDKRPPVGWLRQGEMNGISYYAPTRQNDRDLWRKMDRLGSLGNRELHAEFTGSPFVSRAVNSTNQLAYISYEKIGDNFYLFVPMTNSMSNSMSNSMPSSAADAFIPPEAVELSLEQFEALTDLNRHPDYEAGFFDAKEGLDLDESKPPVYVAGWNAWLSTQKLLSDSGFTDDGHGGFDVSLSVNVGELRALSKGGA